MLKHYFKYPRVVARLRCGALGSKMDIIATHLSKAGYRHSTVKLYLARIAHFGAYAVDCGCCTSRPIPHEMVDRYLQTKLSMSARLAAQVAIGHAVRCCSDRFEATPSQYKHEPCERLLTAYLQYLRVIRGLQPKTCEGQILTARRMLAWQHNHLTGQALSEFTAKHVLAMTHDLLAACRSDASRSSTTAYMRSLLRYLHWADLTDQNLARFVPKVPCWRHTHLPPRLAWKDIRRAIDEIDTTTPLGIRDRAIMFLLATTGMRNKELRQLELNDIGWRTGELALRYTKGHRDRVVPLLADAGAALAEYLLHARPQTINRKVFLSGVPPVRHFSHSSSVSSIVRRRLECAGILVSRGGAHLLRHSLATRLVEQRRPIKEVADLLGHQNIDTTSLYVKVSVPQLANVALPFPGGAV